MCAQAPNKQLERTVIRRHVRVGSPLVLLGTVVGLPGCVPTLPHRVTLAPEVTGVVREAGRPLAGVAIYYVEGKIATEGDCGGEIAATTDLDGRFSLEEVKTFRFFLSMGDPIYQYTICTERAGEPVFLWASHRMGSVDTPVELECALEEPVRDAGRGGFGRCTVRYETSNQ